MYRNLKAPIVVQWEVTYDCNKRCVHCYNYWRTENAKICKSSAVNKKLFDKITDDIIENQVFSVVITGGEPLLVIDELYPYIKKLHNHKVHLSFNSNLMLLDDDIAKKLFEAGIRSFLVSFPASNNELDEKITNVSESFEKTIEGIKIAKKHGFKVITNMVVTRVNVDDIYETAKLAKSIGVDKFSINRAMKPENCDNFEKYQLTIEEYKKLPYLMKKIKDELDIEVLSVEANPLCFINDYKLLSEINFNKTCTAGKAFCVIDPRYNVRPCILISETFDGDLKEAWNKMGKYRDESTRPHECLDCAKKNVCDGGCKAERKHICKDVCKLDPYADVNNKFPIKKDTPNLYVELLELEKLFSVNRKIRYRTEDFGGLVMLNTAKYAAVDKPVYEFIVSNIEKTFSVNQFCKVLGYTLSEASLTLKYLLTREIVVNI